MGFRRNADPSALKITWSSTLGQGVVPGVPHTPPPLSHPPPQAVQHAPWAYSVAEDGNLPHTRGSPVSPAPLSAVVPSRRPPFLTPERVQHRHATLLDAFHTADRRLRGYLPFDRVVEIYSLFFHASVAQLKDDELITFVTGCANYNGPDGALVVDYGKLAESLRRRDLDLMSKAEARSLRQTAAVGTYATPERALESAAPAATGVAAALVGQADFADVGRFAQRQPPYAAASAVRGSRSPARPFILGYREDDAAPSAAQAPALLAPDPGVAELRHPPSESRHAISPVRYGRAAPPTATLSPLPPSASPPRRCGRPSPISEQPGGGVGATTSGGAPSSPVYGGGSGGGGGGGSGEYDTTVAGASAAGSLQALLQAAETADADRSGRLHEAQLLTVCRLHGLEESTALLLATMDESLAEDGRVEYVRFVQQLAAARAGTSAREHVAALHHHNQQQHQQQSMPGG